MSKSVAALALLKAAVEAGYSLRITSEGDTLYEGSSPSAAWDAVKSTGEASLHISKPAHRCEWALLMAPGPMTCDPDESVVDHTDLGFIGGWWRDYFQEAA